MHPSLKLEWYEELLRDLKARYPAGQPARLQPAGNLALPQAQQAAAARRCCERLKEAGMGSLPGGGGEILVDRVRKAITVNKCLTDEWLEVHRVWHELGGRSTCTMMFGHVETLAERIETPGAAAAAAGRDGRLHRVHLLDVPARAHRHGRRAAGRGVRVPATQAIARLYLDNIPNIQSSWVTQGLKIGQLALFFGANDMGSLMIEENVVASAGTVHYLTLEQIKTGDPRGGYVPRQRNVFYELIDEVPASPLPVRRRRARDRCPLAVSAMPIIRHDPRRQPDEVLPRPAPRPGPCASITSASTPGPARSSACSAPTAPARRRPCASCAPS